MKKDELYQAIVDNNEPLILELISHDEIKALLADFAECDQLLTFACIENNYTHLLSSLLKHITVTGYFAQHTLAHAAAKGDYDIVKTLLQRGAAHYNLFVKDHQTPLFYACDNGHKNIVELFLSNLMPFQESYTSRRRFDFNNLFNDQYVFLALKAACVNQFIDIIDMMKNIIHRMPKHNYVQLLSDIPIDMIDYLLTIRALDNHILLIIELCKKEKPELIQCIADKYKIDLTLTETRQKMLEAIGSHGNMRTLDYLMRPPFSIDVNQSINGFNESILHIASRYGHTDMVELLLQQGANPNLVDGGGESPLGSACFYGRLEIIDLLLAYNCDVNYINEHGSQHILQIIFCGPIKALAILDRLVIAGYNFHQPSLLMHHAIKYNRLAIIERLVDLRASINHVDKDNGNTPLMSAIQAGKIDIIKLLVQHPSIDHQITNNDGQTAAMMAERASPEIRALFEEINETLSSGSSCRF